MIVSILLSIVAQSDLIKLGQTNLAGQEVAIEVPASKSVSGAMFPFGDEKVEVLSGGALGDRFVAEGGWSDVGAQYSASQKSIADGASSPWLCKVFIFTRVSILDRGSDGLWRFRRGAMDDPEVKNTLAQLASFEAAAEALSGGKLDLRLDVSINNDPIRLRVDKVGDLFGQAFVDEYVAPRFNQDAFETEDKKYNGPFDSVFFIHAGRSSSAQSRLTGETPITGLSYFIDGEAGAARGLSFELLRSWKHHLGRTFRRLGYVVPETLCTPFDTLSFLPEGMWTALINRRGQTDEQYVQRWYRPTQPSSNSWQEVKSDPLGKLPRLSISTLEGVCSGKVASLPYESSQIRSGPIHGDAIGKVAAWKFGDREMTLVDMRFAPIIVPNLLSHNNGKVVGTCIVSGRVWIVTVGDLYAYDKPEAALLGSELPIPASVVSSPPEFAAVEGQLPREVAARGNIRAESAPENEHPDAVSIVEGTGERSGSVQICGAGGKPLFDAASVNEISFWVRSKSISSFSVRFGGIDGELLLGASPKPAELARPTNNAATTDFVRNGAWQQIRFNPQALAEGSLSGPMPVYSVSIAPPSNIRYWERVELANAEIRVAGFQIGKVDQPANLIAPKVDPIESRLMTVHSYGDTLSAEQKAELNSLLQEPSELARVNICAALKRIKYPEGISLLAALGRSLNGYIAQMASEALAFQSTPEAWLALRANLERGSVDHIREYAALGLAEQRDPRTAALLSTLLTARSATARANGARAVAMQSGREPATILMAMVNDFDPYVRYVVTHSANPEFEIVCRKLLWGAVNDPSEIVRLESYRKLLESPIAEFKSEGLKGFRDESAAIRRGMLASLSSPVSSDLLPALRIATTDKDADVVFRALVALSNCSGEISIDDIKAVFTSRDPRIQAQLIATAKAKAISLPEAVRARLRESLDPDVVAAERELP